jgi:hypothetical protein
LSGGWSPKARANRPWSTTNGSSNSSPPTPTGFGHLGGSLPAKRAAGTNTVLGTSGASDLAAVPVELGEAVGPMQILNPAGTAESGKTSTQQSSVKYRG